MDNVITSWLTSLKQYMAMSLLLSSPAHLPQNPRCIALTIASYFLLGWLIVDEQNTYAAICTKIIVELAMLGAIAYIGLYWRRKPSRLVQTYSALTGVNLVITAAAIPLYRTLSNLDTNADNLLLTAWVLILVWNLAVVSLIFARAFEISIQLSAMISFTYFVINLFIVFAIV